MLGNDTVPICESLVIHATFPTGPLAPVQAIPVAHVRDLRAAQMAAARAEKLAASRALKRTHHMRGHVRRVQPVWDSGPATNLLALALAEYARIGNFQGALVGSPDFISRLDDSGALTFRHRDGNILGTFERKKANIRIRGAEAGMVMRDVVSLFCDGPAGRPELATIGARGRTVHMAKSSLWGDRTMRYACMEQGVSGSGKPEATLLLRPLAAPVLVLTDPIELPSRRVLSA
ncbi:hypothetical protein [Jannaschia pohangensis]|nr:hypothetical protein [Jannaschia pohangensis]